jgi:hypothetical protein
MGHHTSSHPLVDVKHAELRLVKKKMEQLGDILVILISISIRRN